MAENSKIEWTDHTFNPWIGCTKVSPGCAHCYAEALVERYGKDFKKRVRTSDAYWRQPLRWNLHCHWCIQCNRWTDGRWCKDGHRFAPRRPRVFCASLADWLDDEVPIEWLADLLKLIHDTPNLGWQLLTKRPENAERINAALKLIDVGSSMWTLGGLVPHNILMGTTVEDHERDYRIRRLLDIPARGHFLSCEPLLGLINLHLSDRRIHWVIGGGESGPKARPMHPDWARQLRDQCKTFDVPFFFKQWGEWRPAVFEDDWIREIDPERIHHWNAKEPPMVRVGKKAAGRLLDGQEWSQFPC